MWEVPHSAKYLILVHWNKDLSAKASRSLLQYKASQVSLGVEGVLQTLTSGIYPGDGNSSVQ